MASILNHIFVFEAAVVFDFSFRHDLSRVFPVAEPDCTDIPAQFALIGTRHVCRHVIPPGPGHAHTAVGHFHWRHRRRLCGLMKLDQQRTANAMSTHPELLLIPIVCRRCCVTGLSIHEGSVDPLRNRFAGI